MPGYDAKAASMPGAMFASDGVVAGPAGGAVAPPPMRYSEEQELGLGLGLANPNPHPNSNPHPDPNPSPRP